MQKAELGKTAGHGCGEGSLRNGPGAEIGQVQGVSKVKTQASS